MAALYPFLSFPPCLQIGAHLALEPGTAGEQRGRARDSAIIHQSGVGGTAASCPSSKVNTLHTSRARALHTTVHVQPSSGLHEGSGNEHRMSLLKKLT